MLKSMFHVNYLYWLEKNVGIKSVGASDDCRPRGKLQISLDDDEYYVLEDCSDDENYVLSDYGITYSGSNAKSEGYSGEQHYALGDYGTSYLKSTTKNGGNQVNVYQQTYREERVKHVDFDKSSSSNNKSNKAVCSYPKHNKY